MKSYKPIKLMMIFILFFHILYINDRNNVVGRTLFITQKISEYKIHHKEIPKNPNSILKSITDSESYCYFLDLNMAGWGNCYMTIDKDNYTVQVQGIFNSTLFESEVNNMEINSKKYR